MRYLFLIILVHWGLFAFAQRQEKVDFIHADVAISIDPVERKVHGAVTYTFKVLEHIDSVFLDARNMQFTSVRLNRKKVGFSNDGKTIGIKKRFKQGRSYMLTLQYMAKPRQTVYFIGWDNVDTSVVSDLSTSLGQNGAERQIWTQGQGKYTSYWLPSFDDMNEKVEFDMDITFDKEYAVIANGKLKAVKESEGHRTWSFDMERPMSSYLLAFALGDYDKKTETSTSGIPLEMYYYPKDSLKVEPTYRYTKRIFDFLEEEIGVPYPWQNYKQIPVRDFLYAGMENTGTTIFSDAFVIDSIAFVDKNYVNVNAHELAHQWFGNLVTEVDGNHHWLHEGFATYYALLAEKEIFGPEYFYWKLYASAQQLDELSRKGRGEALTDPKASSLTFYEKGAWALYMLQEELGESPFKKGIQKYLLEHRFRNVTIKDFIREMEEVSGKDLSGFQNSWLGETTFPFTKAKENLKSSSRDLEQFFELQWELTTSSADNETIIKRYWDANQSLHLKRQILSKYHKSLSEGFLGQLFETNEIQLRQELAIASEKVPPALKNKFRSLLNDKSYVTIENALYKLWVYFPEDRADYLDITKNTVGFHNKNIRLLWLTLALLTKGYEEDMKQDYYTELRGYTSPGYAFETRQGAFQWIHEVFDFTDQNLKDLINASTHHTWQFRKYARGLLDSLMEKDSYKRRFTLLSKQLKGEQQRYITDKLRVE